jgi:Tfp pilus assembly protein PilP
MNMRFCGWMLICGACLWLARPVAAQVPTTAPDAPATTPSAGSEDEGIVEMPPQPGGYTYNPMGRRDPFMSLLRPATASNEARTRVDGLAGTLIAEAALRGIIKNIDGLIAFFQVSDGKSYWARIGQRFYDGEITSIDMGTVTFRQEVTDPLSPVRTKEVKKTLNPSEEATP